MAFGSSPTAAQEVPIGTKAYSCLTPEAKDEVDQLRREISNIDSNLLRYQEDEDTVRNAIKSGRTDDINQFTYMHYFGHDMPGSDAPHSPQELYEQIARLIQYYKDRKELLEKRLVNLINLPPCREPETTTGAPPPVGVTPKLVPTVCAACKAIADKIATIDAEIASDQQKVDNIIRYQSETAASREYVKLLQSRIADRNAQRAKLVAQEAACEKKCALRTGAEERTKAKHATPDSRREKGPPATQRPPATKRPPGAPSHDPRDSAMRQGGG